jgi:hypothetical protein
LMRVRSARSASMPPRALQETSTMEMGEQLPHWSTAEQGPDLLHQH